MHLSQVDVAQQINAYKSGQPHQAPTEEFTNVRLGCVFYVIIKITTNKIYI